MERSVELKFHGFMRDLCPKGLVFSGRNLAEVINGASKQIKELTPKIGEEKFQIKVHGFNSQSSIYEDFPEDITEIHIFPDLSGGKSGGFFKIVIGVVIVAAAFATGGAALTAAGGLTTTTIGGFALNFGVSLILGGLFELLSPAPKIDTTPQQQDPEASKYLGGSGNTVKIGTRIPLLYGRHKAFGHYISFNIDAKDVS